MRKGISFTMTIIITAVILMTAALTLVTLFGSSIGQFFGTMSGTSTTAQVKNECGAVIRNIDNQICSRYPIEEDDGDGYELSRFGGGNESCNELRCSLDYNSDNKISVGGFGEGSTIEKTIEYTVQVQGEKYDCLDEGYLVRSCPVTDSQLY